MQVFREDTTHNIDYFPELASLLILRAAQHTVAPEIVANLQLKWQQFEIASLGTFLQLSTPCFGRYKIRLAFNSMAYHPISPTGAIDAWCKDQAFSALGCQRGVWVWCDDVEALQSKQLVCFLKLLSVLGDELVLSHRRRKSRKRLGEYSSIKRLCRSGTGGCLEEVCNHFLGRCLKVEGVSFTEIYSVVFADSLEFLHPWREEALLPC